MIQQALAGTRSQPLAMPQGQAGPKCRALRRIQLVERGRRRPNLRRKGWKR
jgi:hypothetical protein